MVEKIRHQLFLPKPVSDRLEALAAKPGASKSAILTDAVTAWLNRRGASELEITVRDASKTPPLRLDADGTRVGGRGVAMIAALSDTWGVRDEVDGKTVWAKLAHN